MLCPPPAFPKLVATFVQIRLVVLRGTPRPRGFITAVASHRRERTAAGVVQRAVPTSL